MGSLDVYTPDCKILPNKLKIHNLPQFILHGVDESSLAVRKVPARLGITDLA
jgi:hypothetical protein